MATKKAAIPVDEKFEKQDFNLFDSLAAIDKKDYFWYKNLTDEQRKGFVVYMMTHWASAIKGTGDIPRYYLQSVDEIANRYLFNEHVQKHPELQWMMLCAASPGIGKQFHQWIPHLKSKVVELKEPAKLKDVKEYYAKIYSKISPDDIEELSKAFVQEHKKKCYLADTFPTLKQSDIETLSQLITDEDIRKYEQERGN
jgi:hypothetical protein